MPTDRRVVFLTIDDGDDRDPEFVRMMRELRVPYGVFLSHYLAKEDYGSFRGMQQLGTGLHNPPCTPLPAGAGRGRTAQGDLRAAAQPAARDRSPARLFRPPYGEYTGQTLRIARSCGIRVVPLWTQDAFPDRIDYGGAGRRLHPGTSS
ncbi:polysaccharide deacetylase family protein [Streptomyces sp. NPDC017993]|uniref:polysaccharide deacetylase family protein n=1 Tax=Streptomyces sp. NPDC017993 TaxID=3365027 RepID=UPI0037B11D58